MSSTDDDPEKLAQALEHLETERAKRIEQRISSGEVRLLPPRVVGIPGTAEPEPGIIRGYLREDGSIERLDFIVTGVCRTGRDCEPSEFHRRPAVGTEVPIHREPGVRLSQLAQMRQFESAPDGPWIDISTSIAGKTESDPGRIISGSYRHKSGGYVEIRDENGKGLGTSAIVPGDNIEVFVRKQLREAYKRGTGDFWDRLNR
jgi:hypothetical protein